MLHLHLSHGCAWWAASPYEGYGTVGKGGRAPRGSQGRSRRSNAGGGVQSMVASHVTRTILRFLVFGAVGSLLSTGQALAWHIGTPTVTPDSLVVGVATPVTVTAVIDHHSVVPDSVILQSVDSHGRLLA